MKTLKLFVFGLMFIATTQSQAQVSVNINFGTPPVWAPADRVEVQYYYLPEVDAYYDVPAERFIYISNGGWVRSERLPARYSGYNLRGGRIVYLTDYRGNSPYVYHKKHKVKYVSTRYRQPERVVYVKKHDDRGKHKDHGKGRKHDD